MKVSTSAKGCRRTLDFHRFSRAGISVHSWLLLIWTRQKLDVPIKKKKSQAKAVFSFFHLWENMAKGKLHQPACTRRKVFPV